MEVIKEKLQKVQPIEFGLAFVIFILGIVLSYLEFETEGNNLYLMYFLVLLGAIIGAFIWIKAINRFFGSFSYYLVEHKWGRKVISGGSYSYYGYKDPNKTSTKSVILDPFRQVLTLLLVFVGISVFFMGFLNDEAPENPLIWGIFAIIVPIIATPLVPILWALQDANVKAYSSGNDTTWMVGKRYKARFNSFITIAAIYSNLKDTDAGDLIDQLKVFLGVITTGILVMLISVSIFIIIYYGWFKEDLSDRLKTSLSLETIEIQLKKHDTLTVDKELDDEKPIADPDDAEEAKSVVDDTSLEEPQTIESPELKEENMENNENLVSPDVVSEQTDVSSKEDEINLEEDSEDISNK